MNTLHADQPVLSAGEPLGSARAAVVTIHGRGDSARGIRSLADAFGQEGVAYVAPQAANNTWYPYSFLEPMDRNEPWLSSALAAVGAVVDEVTRTGVPREQVVLLGFSQGACLASEFAARNANRFGGVVALSGGLIGPPGTPRQYDGSFAGTPVFVGCSDVDPHIPVDRVHETAEVLAAMGAAVEKRIYTNFGHTVNQDEVEWVQELLARLVGTR
jgi:phospholipase/carboxylesterase